MRAEQTIRPDYRKLSDEELVHRYAHKQEHTAILLLFERYGHAVLGTCMKYLGSIPSAKRTTQEIFDKLPENLAKAKVTNFKWWLYNQALEHCRSKHAGELSVVPEEVGDDGQYMVMTDTQLLHLEEEIRSLNKEQRTCIEHFYVQQQSYTAIASQTGMPLENVKRAIQNGRQNLKMRMNEKGKRRL